MRARRPAASTSCRGVVELVDAARAEDDVGARLGEGLSERDAEAGGGAGDDGDLAVEAERVEDGGQGGFGHRENLSLRVYAPE